MKTISASSSPQRRRQLVTANAVAFGLASLLLAFSVGQGAAWVVLGLLAIGLVLALTLLVVRDVRNKAARVIVDEDGVSDRRAGTRVEWPQIASGYTASLLGRDLLCLELRGSGEAAAIKGFLPKVRQSWRRKAGLEGVVIDSSGLDVSAEQVLAAIVENSGEKGIAVRIEPRRVVGPRLVPLFPGR